MLFKAKIQCWRTLHIRKFSVCYIEPGRVSITFSLMPLSPEALIMDRINNKLLESSQPLLMTGFPVEALRIGENISSHRDPPTENTYGGSYHASS